MKKIISRMLVASVFTVGIVACTNDKPVVGNGELGVITVGIKSAAPTRSMLNNPTAVSAFENAVLNFDAYVFDWATGMLEATGTSPDGQPIPISNVSTAGSKRIVVIANGVGISTVPSLAENGNPLTHYDDLAAASVSIANQLMSDTEITTPIRGLLMTGENASEFNVVAGNSNSIDIPVKRVVSKIQLGNITFDQGVRVSDLQLFDITEAGIQKAIGTTGIGTGAITPITDPAPYYYGGFAGPSSVMTATELVNSGIDLASFISTLTTALAPSDPDMTLLQAIGAASGFDTGLLTKAVNGFWYVLPNDGSTGNPTLLTLHGSYDGTEFYYPIEVNAPDSGATGTGAGTYLQRNTVYNLNITFKELVGTTDPDTPGKMVNVSVTVTPEPWAGPVVQNTTW